MHIRYAIPTFFTTEPPLTTISWNEGDATERARILFQKGIYPANLDDFLDFMQHWGSLFGKPPQTGGSMQSEKRTLRV
jgi:hypothetical protein